MPNWLLQTLSDIFNRQQETESSSYVLDREQMSQNPSVSKTRAKGKAQGEWFGAIAALEQLLLGIVNDRPSDKQCDRGLILSGPAPILSHPALVYRFQTGIFTSEAFKNLALMPCQLPGTQIFPAKEVASPIAELPLLPKDPIAEELFCLIFTSSFGLVMVLGEDDRGIPAFQFSFEPEIIEQAWQIMRSRLLLVNHHQLDRLDDLVKQFAPVPPDYRLVMNFSRQLLKHLPDVSVLETRKTRYIETTSSTITSEKTAKVVKLSNQKAKRQKVSGKHRDFPDRQLGLVDSVVAEQPEVELLQALTHEIRTPLTTIRTLTRLLLKRRCHLTPKAIERLELIDQECTEQINRMELIFRAAELETTPVKQKRVQLIPISLEQVLQQSIPRWKKQAQRRNVMLDFILPKKLPQVISDPGMLDQVLTGLMENVTKSLPSGGQVRVQVTNAGNQLKLHLVSKCTRQSNPLKSIGQLLMFQPETGSLSLNLEVTKNLFHVLGGKLIVRNRPKQGEVLTIFLPLDNLHTQRLS